MRKKRKKKMKNKNTWKNNNKLNESGRRLQEDYGWEVPYDNIWDLYEEMKEAFGAEELLESIVRAMGTYDLGDILAYICRMNDFDSQYLAGNEDDEDEEEDDDEDEEDEE